MDYSSLCRSHRSWLSNFCRNCCWKPHHFPIPELYLNSRAPSSFLISNLSPNDWLTSLFPPVIVAIWQHLYPFTVLTGAYLSFASKHVSSFSKNIFIVLAKTCLSFCLLFWRRTCLSLLIYWNCFRASWFLIFLANNKSYFGIFRTPSQIILYPFFQFFMNPSFHIYKMLNFIILLHPPFQYNTCT